MFSEGTKRRLGQLAQVTSMTSQFTEDELLYIRHAIVLSDKGTYAENVKGSPYVADGAKVVCTHGKPVYGQSFWTAVIFQNPICGH